MKYFVVKQPKQNYNFVYEYRDDELESDHEDFYEEIDVDDYTFVSEADLRYELRHDHHSFSIDVIYEFIKNKLDAVVAAGNLHAEYQCDDVLSYISKEALAEDLKMGLDQGTLRVAFRLCNGDEEIRELSNWIYPFLAELRGHDGVSQQLDGETVFIISFDRMRRPVLADDMQSKIMRELQKLAMAKYKQYEEEHGYGV